MWSQALWLFSAPCCSEHRGGLVYLCVWGRNQGGLWSPPRSRLTHLHSCRLCQGAPGAAAGEGRADRWPHAALLRLLPQPSQGVLPARQVREAPRGPPGPSFLPQRSWLGRPGRLASPQPRQLPDPLHGVSMPSHYWLALGGSWRLRVGLQGRRGHWGAVQTGLSE